MRKSLELVKGKPNRNPEKSTTSSPSEKKPASSASLPKLKRAPSKFALVRSAAALRRLGVKQSDLAKVPPISDLLARAYGRPGGLGGEIIPGNPRKAVDDLRFSPDPIAQKFIETWDAIPKRDRESLSIEAVCLKAQVSPQEFLGHVFLMRQSLSKAESSLVAVNSFPDVVRNMVTYASLPGGDVDRKMLAQHHAIGFLPTPKGTSVSVNLFGGEAKFSSENDDEGDDPEFAGFNDAFSGGNKELDEWSNDRNLLLGDGK